MFARSLAPLAVLLALLGCSEPNELRVDEAWVRLSPVPNRPSSGYFTIHGAQVPVTLIGVTATTALRTEMHETSNAGGAMRMARIERVPVAAGETVKFAPGGRHLMLFGMNWTIKPGSMVPLILTFANGARITVDARAQAMGAPPPEFE